MRAPHGNLQCVSYPTGPVRDPCGTRNGAVRHPCGHVRKLTQPELAKIHHWRRIWPVWAGMGPLRSPHGLFTGCLRFQNPYGARKLIMHALKLYGPRTGRQHSYGAARGPCVSREWTHDFCSKQPVGQGVWCDWVINVFSLSLYIPIFIVNEPLFYQYGLTLIPEWFSKHISR